MNNNLKKMLAFLLKEKKMACSASLPQVVLFISKDKLLDCTTILVKMQEQVKRENINSHPQEKKITNDPIHKFRKHTLVLK